MEDIIRELHMDYSDMLITGLFLVYPTCYIHVLEVLNTQVQNINALIIN